MTPAVCRCPPIGRIRFAPSGFCDEAETGRTADPMLIAEAVRRQVRAIEPNRAVYDIKRVTEAVSDSLSARRFQTTLLGLFAGTALLLAVIGLYCVMSFFVSQRTREIGLRIALGARPAQIVARVFRIAGVMTAAGVAFFRREPFFSGGGCRSLFFNCPITMLVTNFFSPWSSNLITIRSSLLDMTVPRPNFWCST